MTEAADQGVFFRSSPTGWTFFHSIFLWFTATAATMGYYFLVVPLADTLPPASAWAWLPLGLVALGTAIKIPPRIATFRAVKHLLLFAVALVSSHLGATRVAAVPSPLEWVGPMALACFCVVALEFGYAARRRSSLYAVGVYPDRFEFEEPGRLRVWKWESVSVAWEAKTREYVVRGPGRDEARLTADLARRREVVALIESNTGKKCKDL